MEFFRCSSKSWKLRFNAFNWRTWERDVHSPYAMGTHVSFIFKGYNPYFGGLKPAFFMQKHACGFTLWGLYIGILKPRKTMEHTHPKNDARSPQGISFEKGGLLSGYMSDHDLGGITHQWGRQEFTSPTSSGYVVEPTHLKNMSQNGNLPQVGVKIQHVWNHHLVIIIITTTT